ncbi:MAG: N-acetylmuramoyl-L-alanine amidase, partial [Candidatus Taylorbacteria bacterium]|nr:N-acetylmuramoyl-L-alanine amidase [Candidatus Taylorbacteria bacterium]
VVCYNETMRHYLAVLFCVILFAVPWLSFNYPYSVNEALSIFNAAADQIATVVMHNPKTIAGLQSKYNIDVAQGRAKIRVLIVPGHNPDFGGAEYGNIKERNLTVVLADDLAKFLRDNGKYEVFETRDTLSWSPTFTAYFKDHWNEIVDWQKSYRNEMTQLISMGSVSKPVSSVYHNTAPLNVAYRLYGITKWSNENNIDIVIHVHLNDYPGHMSNVPGKYSGFVIYVPSKQYLNGNTTSMIADKVFKRLAKYNPVSDLPGESAGVVDDAELIAIGAYNTSDTPNMLIEYGYLYEQQFVDSDLRGQALNDLAYQTYLGLQDFFDQTGAAALARPYDTLVLPHDWNSIIAAKSSAPEVFALQTALAVGGYYPPADKKMNDCPRNGSLGPCTKEALADFQSKHGISGESGVAGQKTLEALKELYSIKAVN